MTPCDDKTYDFRLLQLNERALASDLLSIDLPDSPLDNYLDCSSSILGAFSNGQLVSCLHWSVKSARWLGMRIRIGQCGPGATAHGHRGKHLMKQLVRNALEHMRTQSIVFAGQETPIIAYHRSCGWEIATFSQRHRVKWELIEQTAIASIEARRAIPADCEHLERLWATCVGRGAFTADRDCEAWQRLLACGTWWVTSDPIRGITGYARSPSTTLFRDLTSLDELVTTDHSATIALLRTALTAAGATHVEWWTPANDAHFYIVPDPRAIQCSVEPDKLLRVSDASAVLGAIAMHSPPTAACIVRIRDHLCEWNQVDLRITADSLPVVSPGGKPDLEIDVRALAALATKSVNPKELHSAGLLSGALPTWLRCESLDSPSWYPDVL